MGMALLWFMVVWEPMTQEILCVKGRMDSIKYQHTLDVPQSLKKLNLKRSWMFQQDNDQTPLLQNRP